MRPFTGCDAQLLPYRYYIEEKYGPEYRAQTPDFGQTPISIIIPDPPYSTYRHGRSNGWPFLTSTNPRPCTVSEKCVKYECLCNFEVGLFGIAGKRARRSKFVFFRPKTRKNSELV